MVAKDAQSDTDLTALTSVVADLSASFSLIPVSGREAGSATGCGRSRVDERERSKG